MFKSSFLVTVVGVVAYFVYSNFCVTDSLIVKTENGLIKGRQTISRDGKIFSEYLGIPYARAPVGELRYANPQKLEDIWEGVRLSQKYGAECPQFDFIGGSRKTEEDCLFLNVFTPKAGENSKLGLLPVIVFIHGGGFMTGSGNGIGAHYLIDEDIILVTINYRLGPLGFLNTQDGLIPGNMGLKDQVMALHWIQRNIENFGGDKNRVTIMGQSAGAVCVEFHLTCPMSKGLFHAAISHSSSALGLTIRKKTKPQAQRHAKQLNCPIEDPKEMVSCLKRTSVSDIVDVLEETKDILSTDTLALFGPSMEPAGDGAFLSVHSYDLIQSGKASDVSWLSGYNSDEGDLFIGFLGRRLANLEKLNDHFKNKFHQILFWYHLGNPAHKTDLLQKVRNSYFGSKEPKGLEVSKTYSKIFTDGLFAYGISESMKMHAKNRSAPIYPYYYSYHGKFQLANFLLALKGDYPLILEALAYMAKTWLNDNFLGGKDVLNGAGHGDELALVFKMIDFGSNIHAGHADYEMSRKMVKLWASFAKGEKNLNLDGVHLPRLGENEERIKYLRIISKPDIIPQPHQDRIRIWKNSLMMTTE